MKEVNSLFRKLKVIILLTILLAWLTPKLQEIQAQSSESDLPTIRFGRPQPEGKIESPGNTEGAGGRGSCPEIDFNLTALVPSVQESDEITHVWGLTLEESPTFWFYIPYSPQDITVEKFVLWDETDPNHRKHQFIYEGNFEIIETPGVISLSLPSSIKLEKNKRYHWYFSISVQCQSQNGELEKVSMGVNGWVWIDPEIRDTVQPLLSEEMSDRQKAIILAENGVWQDAITLIGQNPQESSFRIDWSKLLEDIGQERFASEPIINCCSLDANTP